MKSPNKEKANAKSEIIKLDTGGRLVVERMPSMESFTLGLFLPVGSAYETKELGGISHFIEHMLFKGSKKRSAKQIVKAIERVGGIINASTGREVTYFFIRIAAHRLELALDVLTDLIFNPVFDAGAIDKEKGVVLEEMHMYEDDPSQALYHKFMRGVHGNTSYGRPILGSEESVNALNLSKVRKFHKSYYTTGNLIASIAGGVDPDKVRSLMEKKLSAFKKNKTAYKGNTGKPKFRSKIIVQPKDVEQSALIVGFPSVSVHDETRYAWSLLDAVTAGGMMSRLFQEIREKRGLVYSIDSTHQPYRKAGLFTVESGMREENLLEVLRLVLRELKRLSVNGPGKRELGDARLYLKGHWALGLESTSARMVRNAMSTLFFDRILPHEEVVAKLDAVTVDDVAMAASRAFEEGGLSVGALSRFENGNIAKDVKEKIREMCMM